MIEIIVSLVGGGLVASIFFVIALIFRPVSWKNAQKSTGKILQCVREEHHHFSGNYPRKYTICKYIVEFTENGKTHQIHSVDYDHLDKKYQEDDIIPILYFTNKNGHIFLKIDDKELRSNEDKKGAYHLCLFIAVAMIFLTLGSTFFW